MAPTWAGPGLFSVTSMKVNPNVFKNVTQKNIYMTQVLLEVESENYSRENQSYRSDYIVKQGSNVIIKVKVKDGPNRTISGIEILSTFSIQEYFKNDG